MKTLTLTWDYVYDSKKLVEHVEKLLTGGIVQ